LYTLQINPFNQLKEETEKIYLLSNITANYLQINRKMDLDSSSKFISSLAKFLQSLCNGYVEFDNGVEVIGHIYINVDTGKKIDYILNEKVCKNDQNSVTFISNSFHATPATVEKPKSEPKVPKQVEQEKPCSDPGGLRGDDDEIMILDEGESSNLELRGEIMQPSTQSPHPKRGRPSKKRSYNQSFAQNNPLQNPNGISHDQSVAHSDNGSASFNISGSYSHSKSSEQNVSHATTSVFPQFSQSPSFSEGSKDVKEEPPHVKLELDPSGQEEEDTYDETRDPNAYGGVYDDSYYRGPGRGQSGIEGDLYLEAAGPSGEMMGDGSGKPPKGFGFTCPVADCKSSQFSQLHHFKRHWTEQHEGLVEHHVCLICGYASKRKSNLMNHMKQKHPHIKPEERLGGVQLYENKNFINPYPFTKESVFGVTIKGDPHAL